MNNVVAVVFAHNEAAYLPRTLQILNQHKREGRINKIIVIDDGSKDRTKLIAKKAGAIVVSHPQNMGKRASFISGAKKAKTLGAEIMLNFDADLINLPTNTLTSMIRGIRNGKDMIIAQQMERSLADKGVKEINLRTDFAKTLVKRSNAQRAIKMSALAPLFNGNKKWLRLLSNPIRGRSNMAEVWEYTRPGLNKEMKTEKNRWGLEAALDVLIRKYDFTEGKVYTEAAFRKERSGVDKSRISLVEEAQGIAARKMERIMEARKRLAEMKWRKRALTRQQKLGRK